MKSLSFDAARTLRVHAADLQSIDDFGGDAEIVLHVASELERVRHYLLPVGGEVIRNELVAGGVLPVSQCQFPSSSFTIEFNVSEKGFLGSGGYMVAPTFVRLALIQDLRDPALYARWWSMLSLFPDLGSRVRPDHVLIVTVNRLTSTELTEGPGNRGWILGWAAVLIPMAQPDAAIGAESTPNGPLVASSLERHPLLLGHTGVLTGNKMMENGADLETEMSREYALEMLAAVDLGLAIARDKANLRLEPRGGRNVWRAGSGPLMPKRLLG